MLQPKDLPAGWKGTPYQAGADADNADAAMTKCVGGRDTDQDKVADANSEDYSLGDNSISSSATSYRSQSDIDADIAVLHSHKLEACMVQLAKKEIASSLPAGAKVESASMKITPGAAGGPSNVVATGAGNVKVTVNNRQATVYLNEVFITGPLIEADLDTETLGEPLPAPILKSLIAAVARRAAKG